jgi:DNA-binding CsgD family transcriptional regulator
VPVVERFERICAADHDDRALRAALLTELRRVVPFDAYAWVLTDPDTYVGWSPLAEVPRLEDLPDVIRFRYCEPVNRWTALPVDGVASLSRLRERSVLWTELLAGYGIDDVASAVFGDPFGCWAFLELWRAGSAFTDTELDVLRDLVRVATRALRRSVARLFELGPPGAVAVRGPVVLLLGEDLRPRLQTAETDRVLRELLPTESDRSPVPAAAFNVAAQLLAAEREVDDHPPAARAHAGDGRWVTLRAARLVDSDPIAVSVEPTRAAERVRLFACATGLSEREAELLDCLMTGAATREIARQIHMSEHTVQDHLKSVFAKTGVRNRRRLVALATGVG